MTDLKLVLKYLNRHHNNDNNIIYLFVCENVRSAKRAKEFLTKSCSDIFYPSFSQLEIEKAVEWFLNEKKKQYLKGEIIVKPFY